MTTTMEREREVIGWYFCALKTKEMRNNEQQDANASQQKHIKRGNVIADGWHARMET
jgi:hypothetical protein